MHPRSRSFGSKKTWIQALVLGFLLAVHAPPGGGAAPEERVAAIVAAGHLSPLLDGVDVLFFHPPTGLVVANSTSLPPGFGPVYADTWGSGLGLSDPLLGEQWALDALDMRGAWRFGSGAGIPLVAVIDSGVADSHPDAPLFITRGTDYVDADIHPKDAHGHGTHLAGIIAAPRGNGEGIAGMTDARLLVLRVLDDSNRGTCLDFALAILEAVDRGADVLNLSFACPTDYLPLRLAVEYAVRQERVLVAAAGNLAGQSPGACPTYPARYPGVITVGAIDSSLEIARYSCRTGTDMVAPGSGILSLGLDGYATASGTSMAAAHVSAAVAMLLSHEPSLRPHEVETALAQTALDLGPIGHDESYGAGMIQPYQVLHWRSARS